MLDRAINATSRVAVVCSFFNRADFIRDTIDSLFDQDLSEFELVFINDGSTDPRVREILDSYNDSRLRVIHQENTGFVRAIRRAIDCTSAPLIAIQGAGDVSLPGRLRLQAEFLEENLNYIGVGCLREQCTMYLDGAVSNVVITGDAHYNITDIDFLTTNPFSHGEVMFRSSVYKHVGGYREFFKFAQDRDLWLRMSELGSFAIVPTVLYRRRIFEADGVAASAKKAILQQTFSVFARQCATYRGLWGVDLVDMYGMQAGLFREKDLRLANYYAKMSAKYLYYGHAKSAWVLARLSTNEILTAQGVVVRILVFLSLKSKSLSLLAQWLMGKVGFIDQKSFDPILRETGDD